MMRERTKSPTKESGLGKLEDISERNGGKFERTNEFLVANQWLLWTMLLAILAWNVYVDVYRNKKLDAATERIEQMSHGVVMLDLAGRPLKTKMTPVTSTDPAFQKAIVNYLKMYTYYDWATLTHNYNYVLHGLQDLYKRNPDIKEFRDLFFTEGSRGQKQFDAYMLNLLHLIAKNKLPNIIKVISVNIGSYNTSRDGFEAKVEFKVLISWYDAAMDKTISKEGDATVRVAGAFNPLRGSPVNPLGINFDREFNPTLIVVK
jgi:hypothetical protein